MRTRWDIVIIGAGPTGMAAALKAAEQHLSVLVLDRQQEPGGQIYRNVGSASQEKQTFLGSDYTRGRDLVRRFLAADITFLGGANVWHLMPGQVYVSHEGKSTALTARQILVATGGMERPVPVPGWTLPGVLGAGAADVLLKSAGLAPEGPVILCGNGPLILQAAVHLKHLGIAIAGILLTGSLSNPLKAVTRLPGALLRPLYLAHGMGMGVRTVLSGAPVHVGVHKPVISKSGDTFTVAFTSLGKARSVQGSTVLLHEGVVSESRITQLARCRHAWNAEQRYWHVEADIWGRTDVPGMRATGDCAGVRGADAAVALGELAGLDMARELGRLQLAERDALARAAQRQLCRCKAMQPFMDRVFAPSPEQLLPADEAIVCRCEELTAGELAATIKSGCYSPDGLKAQARPGMGTCQGRMCSAAVAEMIAHVQGLPLETLETYHAQPPLFPLSIGELATMSAPNQGL